MAPRAPLVLYTPPPNLAAFERRHARENEAYLLPVTHHFIPGFYCRQITMPAGFRLTSKVHMVEHTYYISKGSAIIWTEEAGEQKITAPFCGVTKPFTKRALLIIEEMVFTTFHPNPANETDLKKIEAANIYNPDIALT